LVQLPNEEAQEKYRRKAETTLTLAQSSDPKDVAEYQWRITTPLATILLALIAVPLARSAPRESRFRNVAIALLAYITLFAMVACCAPSSSKANSGLPGLWTAYALQAALLAVLVTTRLKRR
jgi:lipopolysaccharide export system permease protein